MKKKKSVLNPKNPFSLDQTKHQKKEEKTSVGEKEKKIPPRHTRFLSRHFFGFYHRAIANLRLL